MSTSGGGAASISPTSLANPTSGIGSELGGLLSSVAGGNPGSGDAALGGSLGGLAGSLLLGPLGGLLGAFGGDFIGSLFGGGVPREAKTSSIAQALQGSPNQLDELLGQFAQKGVNAGNVLSESGSSTFGNSLQRVAGMLEALTGQQIQGVTGTGNFQNDPSLNFTKLGRVASHLQIPQGYEFVTDPSAINTAFQDISKMTPLQAGGGSKGAEGEWQRLLNELISHGTLQRYKGSLGSPGATTTSAGAIPNVSLPHPFQQQNNPAAAAPPYPV